MNLVDVAILALAAVALVDGYRRGAALTAGQYIGLFGGLIAGAAIAPQLVDRFGITGVSRGALFALGIALAGAAIGIFAGTALAIPVQRAFARFAVTSMLDRLLGAGISLVVILAATLTLARSLAGGPNESVASAVQRSTLVRQLNDVAPAQPAFLTRFEQVLSRAVGASAFAGIEPALPRRLPIDSSTATAPGVVAAASAVVKVQGRGCGGTISGSGFPIAPDQILTNAHVVAGTTATTVRSPDGARVLPATVVLFDPASDVAVLNVPGLGATPLVFATATRGTVAAVIGYPGGGPERIVSAVVDGELKAQGYDIFNRNPATREVLVVEGDVQPGNSGGPLVNAKGAVLGVVFARSLSQPGAGFALAPAEFAPDLASLAAGHPVVAPGRYECAG